MVSWVRPGTACRSPPRSRGTNSPLWRVMSRRGLRRTRGSRRRCAPDRAADREDELGQCARRSSFSVSLPSKRAPWCRSNWLVRAALRERGGPRGIEARFNFLLIAQTQRSICWRKRARHPRRCSSSSRSGVDALDEFRETFAVARDSKGCAFRQNVSVEPIFDASTPTYAISIFPLPSSTGLLRPKRLFEVDGQTEGRPG